MSSKTKSTLKLIAINIVVLMVLMHLNIVVIPVLVSYKFWLMVAAVVMLVLAG